MQPLNLDTTFVTSLRCVLCGESHDPRDAEYVCPRCGDEGILDVQYDYERARPFFTPAALAASTERGMWRYRPLLPLPASAPVPPLETGMTPLYDAPRLAAALGLGTVLVKDDSRQPTASFKDRASALAVALAGLRGASAVATASTGNAAAALAGMAASTGTPCVIFVPASAPKAKIAQLLAYGATVFAVEGTYDQAFDICMAACRRMGWYNRNTGYNPYMAEGKKTAAFEICEQMGWRAPDAVFVGVGDGCIIAGLHKGFADLAALGLIERMPRLYGVQAAGSDFLARCFETGQDPLRAAPIEAKTVADSISAGLPRDRIKAMAAVVRTGGSFVRVEDDEILRAIPDLAAHTGVFAEPAAAASLAGLRRAATEGLVAPHETVCIVATGSGLKDVAAAERACAALGRHTISMSPGILTDQRLLDEALAAARPAR
ncbi:threonine synthase [Alkalidesulfovibrio alkalitolerans DSM 16529]|uniref:Threonine synthase n=1 Tax=Alkalidesulfovibrio alkalitolerans DSM 16529 TaxID=1121439 RepID=S7TE60_9BACT|nr:threonine synthase [Alkalidesulfovibrio alkalitolerans]EPR34865.1 threonine synthase [Alkalidesulfovibrio alkalitolerans DSM 16529]